jgi:hypothetical protein
MSLLSKRLVFVLSDDGSSQIHIIDVSQNCLPDTCVFMYICVCVCVSDILNLLPLLFKQMKNRVQSILYYVSTEYYIT